ncbi:MAG: EAL domain-containing protein [Betaproteobacteria bacterium]|jgi:diguanylate cyclase (GGDEF)-like protein/PAS domain S-box-containing protein
MASPVPAPQARLAAQTLRERIVDELTRIMRGWVAVSMGLLGLLAVGVSGYDARTRLHQESDLIATKLRADIDNVSRQLQSLAGSPLLWTGLTDSYGRESYLRPLLARFNAAGGSPITVLDYRGRLFLGTADHADARVLASEPLKRAVQQGRAQYGLMQVDEQNRRLVMVMPVLSPQTASPAGFILADFDPDAALEGLPLRAGLSLELTDPAQVDAAAASVHGLLRYSASLQAGQDPLRVNLGLQVSRGTGAVLWLMLVIAGVTAALGLVLMAQLKAWAREFAAGTSRRLEELVGYCREILAGKPMTVQEGYPRNDEISSVFEALHGMLRQQQRDTEALRASARVFNTAAEAILITDAQGRIADVNPALERLTGFARQELLGQPAGMLYHGADTQRGSARIRQALDADEVWRGETGFRARDGRLIPTQVAVSRLEEEAGAERRTVAVISDVSPIKAAEEKLRFMAYHDSLTGLPNFRSLTETLQRRLEALDASRSPFLLVFFDMDHLKWVNDSHGHDVGDTVIKGLAQHLRDRLPARHLLCRRSGDEFVAVVELDAVQTLELVRGALADGLNTFHVQAEVGSISVSVSAGVARFPEDATSMQELLICADGALNRVKQHGRAAVGWFDEGLGHKLRRGRLIQTRLAQAIDSGAIRLHYQPEVDLRHGAILGFEALARWPDDELGEVRPSEFIPVAEEAHLMERLTVHVLATVHADRAHIEARFPGSQVSVNARLQALRSRRVLDMLAGRAADGEPAGWPIHLELAEADMHLAAQQLPQEIQTLQGHGVRLVLDDFGSDASSVPRLAGLQGQRVKIDASLIAGMGAAEGLRVVTGMIQLARTLELEISAGGVESADQHHLLLGLGCQRAQGWLYARAMSLEELLALPARLGPGAVAAQGPAPN